MTSIIALPSRSVPDYREQLSVYVDKLLLEAREYLKDAGYGPMTPNEAELEAHTLVVKGLSAYQDVAGDSIVETARRVAQAKLHIYGGYSDEVAWLADALGYSGSAWQTAVQILTIEPFCRQNRIPIPDKPQSYIQEAASHLREVIRDPGKTKRERVCEVKRTLEFVARAGTRQDVRDQYRRTRGGSRLDGIEEFQGDMGTIVIVGPATAIMSARVKLGGHVAWQAGTVTVSQEPGRAKTDPYDLVTVVGTLTLPRENQHE